MPAGTLFTPGVSMPVEQENAVTARQGAWHQSTLSTIHDCARRWFLTYQCGLPDPSGAAATSGTAAHAAVEHHEKERMKDKAVSLEEMLQVGQDALPADATDSMRVSVRTSIIHWWDAPCTEDGELLSHRDYLLTLNPVAIEPYFKMPLVDGALPVAGWVDGVYWDPAHKLYRLVDLKTSNDLSRWKADDPAKRYQATMYSVALQLSDILPEPIDYFAPMTYTIVKSLKGGTVSKRITLQPDLNDVKILGERIRSAEHIVKQDVFPQNTSWYLCSSTWCPHYQRCVVTGELAASPVEVRRNLGVPEKML